jgi:hypothetical protein
MNFLVIMIIVGLAILVLGGVVGAFLQGVKYRYRICLTAAHLVFMMIIAAEFLKFRNDAQGCMTWIPALAVDLPSSLIYAIIHLKNSQISICENWVVPLFFFGIIGSLQYFGVGWILDILPQRKKK